VRGLAMIRDNTDRPATYYPSNVNNPVIPDKSLALQGNAYLSLWF
jgi:hypothetical protein